MQDGRGKVCGAAGEPDRTTRTRLIADYCEQLDATVVTDCTRTFWPLELGIDELPDVLLEVPELLVDGELLLLPDARVPVISTFSPTCLVNSLS